MFDHKHYVPVLKAKAGELDALSKIPSEVCGAFTPLLELIPIPPKWLDGQDDPVPSKNIDAHAEALASSITASCGAGRTTFIDGLYIEDEDVLNDGSEPIAGVLSRLSASGVKPIPVVGFGRVVEYNDACKEFAADKGADLCLRLTEYDLADLGQLETQVRDFLNYLEVAPEQVHLVIDYRAISPAVSGALKAAVPLQVAALPFLPQWQTVTFAASSFPNDLADVAQHSIDTFERTEWDVWMQMRRLDGRIKRVPTFGDYTVTHPELTILDPRKIRISPKIKYCDQLQWVIGKGEAFRRKKDPKKSVPASVQYPALAKKIIRHAAWCGPTFSWGDQYIESCAAGNTTGSLQNWVTVGAVHHIVFVVRQIANLPAP